MTAPRYRLSLSEPLFQISEPLRTVRGLTETELDQLANSLRSVDDELRNYDAKAAPLLAAISALGNPWWDELRSELLHKGEDAGWLDESIGSCSSTEWWRDPPSWLTPLLRDVVQRVDPAPIAATLTEVIHTTGTLDVGTLVAVLHVLMVFHPFGMPHQLHIENFAEVFSTPFGAVKGRIGEVPTKDPEEFLWMPVYEGLLSWIGEIAEVLQDRTNAILMARENVIAQLHYEVKFLAGLEGAPATLPAIADQLFTLNRLLLGLCEEIAHPRRQLIDNLGRILGSYEGRWRKPKENGLHLRHYLRIGVEALILP
jgi:hypothetical protein